ncbi:MAG: hypothetical protein M1378_08850 [Bacteroidetes bacterium]|nr:hypothetical protein [Bacteroidota bacterium]MCL5034944.1 hypothetical protein [Bacteroidota bacterium]
MGQNSQIGSRLRARFESLLRRKISVMLQAMYDRPDEFVDLESGEKYICTVCDLEYKRCEVEPDYRCEIARKRETEFKELELALDRLRRGTFGYCENCSNFIGQKELKKNPTRTFCSECGGRN